MYLIKLRKYEKGYALLSESIKSKSFISRFTKIPKQFLISNFYE